MWHVEETDAYRRRHKKYLKKHRRELLAVLDNLDTVYRALAAGAKTVNIRFGFIHNEPMGIWAIDQKGGGKDLQETRLYIYACAKTEILHVITLGDKNTQHDDIQACKAIVKELAKGVDDVDDATTAKDV